MLSWTLSSQADTKPATTISNLGELQDIILKNNVTLLDQLLDVIPAKMKARVVFVYDSHALHQELVTPETPRMIFFNDDASLIFTIAREQSAEDVKHGEDVLEILSFDKEKNKFQMQNIPFDGAPDPLSRAEVNPSVCLRCHGSNPHPIFQDYNAWPGMYGSFSDAGAIKKGTKEFTFLGSFLSNLDRHPRYKKVDTSAFKKTDYGYSYTTKGDERDATPTSLFGGKIEVLMWTRFASLVKNNPKYQLIKPLLYYLGAKSNVCPSENRRLRDIYTEWTKTDANDSAGKVLQKIRNKVALDFDYKLKSFNEFNAPVDAADARGVLDGPSMSLLVQHDPQFQFDFILDEKMHTLFEGIAQNLGLTIDDFSTFPKAWALGVDQGGTLEDDAIFGNWLAVLGRKIIKQDPSLKPELTDCASARREALEALKNVSIPDPNQPGVEY